VEHDGRHRHLRFHRHRPARARPSEHARQRRKIDMPVRRIDDVLVDLVRDDERIVLFRQLGDEKQFLAREDFAGWVGGIAEDQRLGFLRKGAA